MAPATVLLMLETTPKKCGHRDCQHDVPPFASLCDRCTAWAEARQRENRLRLDAARRGRHEAEQEEIVPCPCMIEAHPELADAKPSQLREFQRWLNRPRVTAPVASGKPQASQEEK